MGLRSLLLDRLPRQVQRREVSSLTPPSFADITESPDREHTLFIPGRQGQPHTLYTLAKSNLCP